MTDWKDSNVKKVALMTLASSAFLSFTFPANAAGHYQPVVIERVAVDSSGRAFVRVDASTSTATSTPPACSTNGLWQVAFDAKTPTGQALLSMVMSAKLSQTPVRLIGDNLCTGYSTIESVYVIDLLPES